MEEEIVDLPLSFLATVHRQYTRDYFILFYVIAIFFYFPFFFSTFVNPLFEKVLFLLDFVFKLFIIKYSDY